VRMEPEVLGAELREMGCPFSVGDPRCQVWLDGYRAGTSAGYHGAAKTLGLQLSPAALAKARDGEVGEAETPNPSSPSGHTP
jgi:hypothetical protein